MKSRKRSVPWFVISLLLFSLIPSWAGVYLPLIKKDPLSSVPILHSVLITPESAPSGSVVNITFKFSFTDFGGDLNGGSLNFIDPSGATNSLIIPGSYQGQTSGTAYGYLNNMEIDLPPGKYTIPVYLKDKAGNQSNTVQVIWTVT
jgi:hypothetical protein